jgi:hypothetical protein
MTAGAAAGPVKDFLEGWLAGFLDQPGAQVFLQGLAGGGRPLTQNRVCVFRDILDLDARHSAIMALEAPVRKRTVIGMSARVAAAQIDRIGIRRGSWSCTGSAPQIGGSVRDGTCCGHIL